MNTKTNLVLFKWHEWYASVLGFIQENVILIQVWLDNIGGNYNTFRRKYENKILTWENWNWGTISHLKIYFYWHP